MDADVELSGDKIESESELSTTERVIASLWREVLQTPGGIDAADDFFELGGDSIGVLNILFGIQETFGVELTVESMFTAPTLRELAGLVDGAANGS